MDRCDEPNIGGHCEKNAEKNATNDGLYTKNHGFYTANVLGTVRRMLQMMDFILKIMDFIRQMYWAL